MGDPYRTNPLSLEHAPRPNFLVRWWYRWVGKLVYGGEPTCGHCKYWTPPAKKPNWGWFRWEETDYRGDCKLLYGKENTKKDETCNRFDAAKRYKHRMRVR